MDLVEKVITNHFRHSLPPHLSISIQDLKQEGCLKLLEAIPKYNPDHDPPTQMGTYLYRAVLNHLITCVDQARTPITVRPRVKEIRTRYSQRSVEALERALGYVLFSEMSSEHSGGPAGGDFAGTVVSSAPRRHYESHEKLIDDQEWTRRCGDLLMAGLGSEEYLMVVRRAEGDTLKTLAGELGLSFQRVSQMWRAAASRARGILISAGLACAMCGRPMADGECECLCGGEAGGSLAFH